MLENWKGIGNRVVNTCAVVHVGCVSGLRWGCVGDRIGSAGVRTIM